MLPNDQANDAGRVLVVDDEQGIRSAIRRLLRPHAVVEASSCEEARRILAADRAFDLILCDVVLPGASGVELHRWLTQDSPALARRLVFITAGTFGKQTKEYLALVENQTISKPFDVATLLDAVQAMIRSSKAVDGSPQD